MSKPTDPTQLAALIKRTEMRLASFGPQKGSNPVIPLFMSDIDAFLECARELQQRHVQLKSALNTLGVLEKWKEKVLSAPLGEIPA